MKPPSQKERGEWTSNDNVMVFLGVSRRYSGLSRIKEITFLTLFIILRAYNSGSRQFLLATTLIIIIT